MPIADIRSHFPLLQQADLTYLDNAATTQKPDHVLEAMEHYYRTFNANVHRGAHRLSDQATEHYEQARRTVQHFIRAEHWHEIVWTKGTTEAINLVAQSWGTRNIQTGDCIVISTAEHHANIVPWQQLCLAKGAELKIVQLTETGAIDLDHYQHLMNLNPKLVAISHISNVMGLLNPLETLIEKAHQAGAKVLIDGAQSLAHEQIDVQQLDCDFFVASAHKAYGPTGIGFLYAKAELLTKMPPWQYGGEMIKQVAFAETLFNDPPFRFEAGTPAIAEAIGFAAALSFLDQQDRLALQQWEENNVCYLYRGLDSLPKVKVIGGLEHRRSLVAFNIEGMHPFDVGQALNLRHIAVRAGHHCAMPLMGYLGLQEGCVRASLACYNAKQDIDKLLNALEDLNQPSPLANGIDSDSNVKAAQTSELISHLVEGLKARKSWQDKLNYLTQPQTLESISTLPDTEKTDANLLHGCTSRVWLTHQYDPTSTCLTFALEADSKIIKGLAGLLVHQVTNQPASSIASMDITALFTEVGLQQHLSPSRSNGIHTIAEAIKATAISYSPQKH